MRKKNILFSLPQRGIYDLNDTAADIWEALEEGRPPSAIVGEIVSRGIPEKQASAHLVTALEQWERLGLIHPEPGPVSPSNPPALRQVLEIAGLRFGIDYPAGIRLPVREVFRHLERHGVTPDVRIRVQDNGARVHLFRDDEWILSCSTEELPTMLKGHLVAEILHRVPYEIALHAAALVHGDRVMLLVGSPGAGKTTLSLALLHAKLRFAGDDVTLLDDHGRATGLPFAPTVKSGAWPVLSKYFPDLRAAPVYRRPDGRKVRYLVPKDLPAAAGRDVGWIVLLHRSDAMARLEAVDPASALRGLLSGAYAATRQLSEAGVEVLVGILRTAPTYRLNCARLDDAVRLLLDAVDDACPRRL